MPDTLSESEDSKKVTIYTDGACSGNPGPGGYGVILLSGGKRKEISAGYRKTTNNRMEIMAAIAGLESLRFPCAVTLITDSKYLMDSIEKGWAKRWQANGWMRNPKERAINVDLWTRMLALCTTHKVTFSWVKGHAGDTENERCDVLSTSVLRSKDLLVDEVYEATAGR